MWASVLPGKKIIIMFASQGVFWLAARRSNCSRRKMCLWCWSKAQLLCCPLFSGQKETNTSVARSREHMNWAAKFGFVLSSIYQDQGQWSAHNGRWGVGGLRRKHCFRVQSLRVHYDAAGLTSEEDAPELGATSKSLFLVSLHFKCLWCHCQTESIHLSILRPI